MMESFVLRFHDSAAIIYNGSFTKCAINDFGIYKMNNLIGIIKVEI